MEGRKGKESRSKMKEGIQLTEGKEEASKENRKEGSNK